jgi:long-chain acyl-CoA synthetase
LNKIGKEAGLQGFEQAKNVYIEPQPFMNKGILTSTMKIVRHEAKKAYKDVITQLYK